MTTGEKIKLARKAAKMTQRELSEKTGIAEPTIRKYESDRLNPKYNTLVTFANALGVRMAYFLNEKTPEEILYNQRYVLEIANELKIDPSAVRESMRDPSGFNSPDLTVKILTTGALLDERRAEKEIESILNFAFTGKLSFPPETAEMKKNRINLEQLIRLHNLLNERGQQVAVERLQELAKIPEYQRKDDDT